MAQMMAGLPSISPSPVSSRVFHAGDFLGLLQAIAVGFGVFEFQRVGGGQARVMLGVAAFVKQHLQPRVRAQLEMMAALGAALQVGLQILLPKDLLALVALHPKPFGLDALLLGGFQRLLFFAEPSHIIGSSGHRVICHSH